MPVWIFASLLAALAQAFRFMLQKSLSLAGISATGATLARFLFSAPFVLLGLVLYFTQSGAAVPNLTAPFWVFAALGGLAQIIATVCVVLIFKERHFAVGVTFAKTEVIVTALIGFVILGDTLNWSSLGAILVGVAGVVVLSVKPDQTWSWGGVTNRSAVLGLVSGALFAVSAVSYRGASLEIEAAPVLRAAMTLGAVTTMQMLALGLWIGLREEGELRRLINAWRRGLPLGILSLTGSLSWFLAFTLQNAAIVKAVGQIELIFVLAIGAVVFGERVQRRELLGMALLASSILGLLVGLDP